MAGTKDNKQERQKVSRKEKAKTPPVVLDSNWIGFEVWKEIFNPISSSSFNFYPWLDDLTTALRLYDLKCWQDLRKMRQSHEYPLYSGVEENCLHQIPE